MSYDSTRQAGDLTETELPSTMLAAGVERLSDLLSAGVGSEYVAEQVYLAMEAARPPRPQTGRP